MFNYFLIRILSRKSNHQNQDIAKSWKNQMFNYFSKGSKATKLVNLSRRRPTLGNHCKDSLVVNQDHSSEGTVTCTAWPPLDAVKYSFHFQKIDVLWLASAVFPFPLWRVYGRSAMTCSKNVKRSFKTNSVFERAHKFEKRPQHRTRMNWFCFCCFLESFLWWSQTFECDFVASRQEFKMSYICKAIWAPMMKFMVTQFWTFSCVKHEPISWKFLRRAYLRSWSCLARVKCFLITASWICACVFILVCTV